MPQDMPVLPAGNRGVGKWGLGRVAQNETLIRDGQRGMVVDIRIVIGRCEGMTRRGRPHECGHYERTFGEDGRLLLRRRRNLEKVGRNS